MARCDAILGSAQDMENELKRMEDEKNVKEQYRMKLFDEMETEYEGTVPGHLPSLFSFGDGVVRGGGWPPT